MATGPPTQLNLDARGCLRDKALNSGDLWPGLLAHRPQGGPRRERRSQATRVTREQFRWDGQMQSPFHPLAV